MTGEAYPMAPQQLVELTQNYSHNIDLRSPQTLEIIRQRDVLGIMGPTGIGKTTLMWELAKMLPDDFGLIQNETTRPPDPRELAGIDEFTRRTPAEVAADIKSGHLVQVMMHPDGTLYSTSPEGYPEGKIGLLPVIAKVVPEFYDLPFHSFEAAGIVSPYAAWWPRVLKQAKNRKWDETKFKKRVNEARESWEYAKSEPRVRLILNDTIEGGVRRLVQLSRGEAPDDEELARQILETNLIRMAA